MNEKARTIVFNISALLLLAGAGLYLALPVAAPYLFAIGAAGITVCYLTMPTKDMDFRRQQIAPLQHICRVAVYIRLRPDVQRTERMDDLPDHFSPASVIHGICHPIKKKTKNEKYLHIVRSIV